MSEVITVNGPIDPDKMGITYCHEHLILDAYDHYPFYEFVIDDEEMVIKELQTFIKAGGKTICDVTLDEIGRNPMALKRISQATGINIIMGSGWYREFGYPAEVQDHTSNELADILVKEIEVGVGDSGIRAGLIGEIGTGRHHIKPAEERVFRAAALAQQKTGVAITTHTTRWGSLALEQIAMLEEFGADLSKVIIGHLGDRLDKSLLFKIAEKGVFLEIDNIGYLDYQPEWVRVESVVALLEAGFVSQILFSEDICSLKHLEYQSGKGYGYILNTFVPLLKERGVSSETIQKILIKNPATAFSRSKRTNGNG